MLAVAEKDQNDHLIWSDGTIVVDWAFDDQGYPDFEKPFSISVTYSTHAMPMTITNGGLKLYTV